MFVVTAEYSVCAPATTGACGVSVMVRSGSAPTVVASTAGLLSGFTSPPPPTVAAFVALVAPGSTCTRIVIGGYDAPGFRLSDRRHVTFCPPIVQVHPTPDASVALNPPGT